MALGTAKITSQGQISIPASVRKRLGLSPGSLIEFDEEDGKVVLRRRGTYNFEDIHKMVFPKGPPKRVSLAEMDEAARQHVRAKFAWMRQPRKKV